MRRIAESFSWPLHAPASSWVGGSLCVLLSPVLFIPLLGYAVAATRAAEHEPPQPVPPWRVGARLLVEGWWAAVALLITLLPFALLLAPLAGMLAPLGSIAGVVAFFVLALPWGLVALLVLPHATARYAASDDPSDMLDFAASLRGVRESFPTWNVVAGALVTSWAIGLACAGALCIGLFPGVFYAILVSAHACAALARPEGARQGTSAR